MNTMRIEDAVEWADQLKKYFKKIAVENPGMEIEMEYELHNTGIVPRMHPDSIYWEEWEDLGGRHFHLDVSIPNHKKPEIAKDEENKETE